MKIFMQIFYVTLIVFFVVNAEENYSDQNIRLDVTITARYRKLELIWMNVPESQKNGYIILTESQPIEGFEKIIVPEFTQQIVPVSWNLSSAEIIPQSFRWKDSASKKFSLFDYKTNGTSGWITTNITYNPSLAQQINISTTCYGYWLSYVNDMGKILGSGCMSAHSTWMNDMREKIKKFRIRDLFIPGTHDSCSYRYEFDPDGNETLVTKYSITQDEDIRGQLMHGIRYIDIRVGYYKFMNTKFWGNHGISRLQPLRKILKQVRDFVVDSNEIIILDFQEFPVGFGKTLEIHQKLVALIQRELGDTIVHDLSWTATLEDIWETGRNVLIGYDHVGVQAEHFSTLMRSVEQRWGNVQSVEDLRNYLEKTSDEMSRSVNSRPKAAMAELTPQVWDVFTDVFGGLRIMSDTVNRNVSMWYAEMWGPITNIVAVDFFRGTNIISTALYWNSRKGTHVPARYDIFA